MCKSEIFAETINLVAQETEIPAAEYYLRIRIRKP
jgi:hypothetical protein